MNQASGKRGGPRLDISEDVAEWQRLSKQKRNARSGFHETVPRENPQSKAITDGISQHERSYVSSLVNEVSGAAGAGAADKGASIQEAYGFNNYECLQLCPRLTKLQHILKNVKFYQREWRGLRKLV